MKPCDERATRDREQAVAAVTRAMFESQPYWEAEPSEAYEVAERIIDAYEALPPVISDEMVERAATAYNERARGSMGARWHELSDIEREYWRKDARAALRSCAESEDNQFSNNGRGQVNPGMRVPRGES